MTHTEQPIPAADAPTIGDDKVPASLVWCCTAVLAYFVLKVSWVADDAYITLRTVDNFLNGYGLRWNVDERVQVYTHPLWMLLLIPFKALISSSLLAMMVPGWLATFATFPLLFKNARTRLGLIAAFCTLALSQSVIDFSTSGLENSLSHLLIVALLASLPSFGFGPGRMSLLLALILLNRLDLAPLVGPLAAVELWRHRRDWRAWCRAMLGMLPLVLWLAFSTVYYGSPFPNTYFAKVAAGIPSERIYVQGVRYFLDVLLYEPLTITLVGAGIAIGLRARRDDAASFLAASGMALHLVYVFKVGGDFMNARFLTPDIVVAAWITMRAADRIATREAWHFQLVAPVTWLTAIAVSAMLLVSDFHSFASRKAEALRPSSITDERQFYFSATGLWLRLWAHLNKGDRFETAHPWSDLGRRLRREQPRNEVFVHNNMGFLGYYAGPRVHIVDGLGLTDAFVARLPVDNFWTAGHGGRIVPAEYVLSLNERRNLMTDPRLHQMFNDLMLVTRSSSLFSLNRFRAGWRLNTGYYRSVGEKAIPEREVERKGPETAHLHDI